MNILYQKGNKLLSTWAFNFRTLQYANGDQVIYLVAPSNDIKLLVLPSDPHHHGRRRSR